MKSSALDGFFDDTDDLLDIEGLGDIVEDPVTDGFNGALQGSKPSDDDDHHIRINHADLFQCFDTRTFLSF